MPIIRNGKTYLTQDELDKKIYDSIRKNAKEVVLEIKKNRKQNIVSNNISYV